MAECIGGQRQSSGFSANCIAQLAELALQPTLTGFLNSQVLTIHILYFCRYDLVPYERPRLIAFVDIDQQHATLHMMFHHQRQKVNTAAAFVAFLKQGLFQLALKIRLLKISRKSDPPFQIAEVTNLSLRQKLIDVSQSSLGPGA